MLEQLIDAEQAKAGFDETHLAGYYQHVDDGQYGDLHFTQQEGAALQAAVTAPVDDKLIDWMLRDIGTSGSNRGAAQKVMVGGVDALMGLISVQPPREAVDKDERRTLLGLAAAGKVSRMTQLHCDLVGGVDVCLDTLVEALGRGLESQPLGCKRCLYPILSSEE